MDVTESGMSRCPTHPRPSVRMLPEITRHAGTDATAGEEPNPESNNPKIAMVESLRFIGKLIFYVVSEKASTRFKEKWVKKECLENPIVKSEHGTKF